MGTIADLSGKRVYLDANVFIYAIDNLPPWNKQAAELMRGVDRGEFHAITSELTLAECLVKPLQTNSAASVTAYEATIRPRPHLTVVPVSRAVLISAAKTRAMGSIKLPDAIHIASSRIELADYYVTNDKGLRNAPGVNCLLLSDLDV